MPIVEIKAASTFDEHINGEKLFHATWCGPCKMIAPKFKEFSDKYTSVVFLKVDVDEVAEVAAKAGIAAMPTFHCYKKGQKVDEIVGADAKALEEAIKKHQ